MTNIDSKRSCLGGNNARGIRFTCTVTSCRKLPPQKLLVLKKVMLSAIVHSISADRLLHFREGSHQHAKLVYAENIDPFRQSSIAILVVFFTATRKAHNQRNPRAQQHIQPSEQWGVSRGGSLSTSNGLCPCFVSWIKEPAKRY